MGTSKKYRFLALIPGLLLGGCATAPAMVVFGAAFPSWLFCLVGGTASTVIVHVVLGYFGKRAWLAPMAISYPALAAAFSLAGWWLFFPH